MSGTPIGSWSETGADGLYDSLDLNISADEGILVWDVIEKKWKIDKTATLSSSSGAVPPPTNGECGMKWDAKAKVWKGNEGEIAQVDWGENK